MNLKKYGKIQKILYFRPVLINDIAMKRSITFKSILIGATVFSLFAFSFVNFRTNATDSQSFAKVELSQNQLDSEEAAESRKIAMPDLSVLGRVWEIAQGLFR